MIRPIAVAVLFSCLSSPLLAITINPGQTLNFSSLPTTSASYGIVGTDLVTSGGLTLDSKVGTQVQGTLAYTYFVVPQSGFLPGGDLVVPGFSGLSVDLAYSLPSNIAVNLPASISRSADGDALDIHFTSTGQGTSPIFHVLTNGTTFVHAASSGSTVSFHLPGSTDAGILFGAVTPAPAATPVPEPAALTALGLAAGLITWRRRKMA